MVVLVSMACMEMQGMRLDKKQTPVCTFSSLNKLIVNKVINFAYYKKACTFVFYFMSKLREKSTFNLDAANHLIKQDLYAPSVHCSYYSCFQLLKYTINDFFGEGYEVQSKNIASGKSSSHQYVINYVSRELKKLTGVTESQGFKRKIKDLRQFRIDSDYENTEINSGKGHKAYQIAIDLRNYITENF